jgi:hypothetical protein
MIKLAQPSVMSLFIVMRFNDKLLATGTGFVAQSPKGPVLITNRHNVTGRDQNSNQPISSTGGVPNTITIMHNQKGKLGWWVNRAEPLFNEERPLWHEHPKLGSKADFVALPLTKLDDVELYPYAPDKPGEDILVGPADVVSVIGFPFGIAAGGGLGVWATGFMASEPDVDQDGLPMFFIDCKSRQGQSGSAVIAYRSGGAVAMRTGGSEMFGGPVWRFLGIYSGRVNKESDLGIVWKAAAISELLNAI